MQTMGPDQLGLGWPLLDVLGVDWVNKYMSLVRGALISFVPVVAERIGKDRCVGVEGNGRDGQPIRIRLEQLLGGHGRTLGLESWGQ